MSEPTPNRRPRVALLIPTNRQADVLTAEAFAHLRRVVDLREVDADTNRLAEHLPSLLDDADACLTGWGTPPLTEAVLANAKQLRLIAHTAGSVKRLVPASVFERGIAVAHAANVIADAVGEFTILVMLLGLRRVHDMDRELKAGVAWREAARSSEPRQLAARTVGLVGMGYVGRKVARLVRAFGARVIAYDPYLPGEDARSLGVEAVSLDQLFREAEVVSVHAPSTPETRRMIGRREFDLLRDRAIFVNCARSWVVDQDALLATLRTGRIWAALDVFDEEPLPLDSPFRTLENAFITPHHAGHTVDTYHRQGQAMVDEIERFFSGGELRYRISPGTFELMA